MEDLDRDLPAQLHVVGEVHLRGGTGADRSHEPVARPEHAADVVGHARNHHQGSFGRVSRADDNSIRETVTGGFARFVPPTGDGVPTAMVEALPCSGKI